jgi:hypothetical protein
VGPDGKEIVDEDPVDESGVTRCALCGAAEHGNVDCALREGKTALEIREAIIARQEADIKQGITCNICMSVGHYTVTCPSRPLGGAAAAEAAGEEEDTEEGSQLPCRGCMQQGHRFADCPLRSVLDEEQLEANASMHRNVQYQARRERANNEQYIPEEEMEDVKLEVATEHMKHGGTTNFLALSRT